MEEQEPKRRGRPATGQTPKRNVRIGQVWDDGEELAHALGMTMTAYVERALRRENPRAARELRGTVPADSRSIG